MDNVDSLEREDYKRGLLFDSLEGVCDAIITLAGGAPSALPSAEQPNSLSLAEEDIDRRLKEAFKKLRDALVLGITPYSGQPLFRGPIGESNPKEDPIIAFGQELISQIRSSEGKSLKINAGTNAPGPFKGAEIDVTTRPDGKFVLGIFVNGLREHETALSERLGIPYERLSDCQIVRKWKSPGERFAIPIKDIESIYTAVECKFDLGAFKEALKIPHGYYGFSPITVRKDEIVVELKPYSYQCSTSKYETKGRDRTYKVESGFLTGPAFIDRDGPASIGLSIHVTPSNTSVVNKETEAKILKLADAVEAVLKANMPGSAAPSPYDSSKRPPDTGADRKDFSAHPGN